MDFIEWLGLNGHPMTGNIHLCGQGSGIAVRHPFGVFISILVVCLAVGHTSYSVDEPAHWMPQTGDYTQMWWAEGFPAHSPGAPWWRCIQTGSYAMVLDTELLRIPHFGPLAGAGRYRAEVGDYSGTWRDLPPADLQLGIEVEDRIYRATAGGSWSRFTGPRIIESGRFFQRADVTDLVFTADDGTKLNVEARLETAAWPDRLGFILAVRPGLMSIQAGEDSFGRVGGGFGLDGSNHLEIPPGQGMDTETFTLGFWAFVPANYMASRHAPWLVCKNAHEQADGHFGIHLRPGRIPAAHMNIGGGRAHAFSAVASSRHALAENAWSHVALSYDGNELCLFVNGSEAARKAIGRKRIPVPGAMAFGKRQDQGRSQDGYRFRGVVDEIRWYDRALSQAELRACVQKPAARIPALEPVRAWAFRSSGTGAKTRPRARWRKAGMFIDLATESERLHRRWTLPPDQTWSSSWQEVSLALDPVAFAVLAPVSPISIQAAELPGGDARPVEYDAAIGWHQVDLNGIQPIRPPGVAADSNDAIERVKLRLSNPTDRERIARVMFEKSAGGIRQRIGAPITGISAVLRDRTGCPTGIPVQLSKNWHNRPEGGVHAGQWFHGISQVRVPAGTTIELELTLAYGHWGGVAAASHAQLSLVGWGSNQLWHQSALGAWGESICFEPDQAQARCTITDVRPLMVHSMRNRKPWGWTSNVGGGDFFRFFDPSGGRIPHTAMRTACHRQGPCLTEVSYAGRIGDGITHAMTVSLARSDDLLRGMYRIRMDVNKPTAFSRFVLFQIGADSYSYTGERKMALGNETGLLREWETRWGGNTYRTEPVECLGRMPWASLHEAVYRDGDKPGAWANRGIIVRAWKARLGGREAAPWMAERGLDIHSNKSSTIDLLPPPGMTRLEPGDFVEAVIEHTVIPQFARDYYGPNQALRTALARDENTWRMIHREATGNDRRVDMVTGHRVHSYPDVRLEAENDRVACRLTGGLGYVPVTFAGLTSARKRTLRVDGTPVDQSIHGNDFWQTDYDPVTGRWSQTFNIPCSGNQTRTLTFGDTPP